MAFFGSLRLFVVLFVTVDSPADSPVVVAVVDVADVINGFPPGFTASGEHCHLFCFRFIV